ncbi:hypothetical protein L1S34_12260 [Flavobacterium sp. K77]|uniref:hypothetical protein n=1 Tax=Flavobacterium sp. K77 TaxID=2910676 RepID=UPI001F45F7C1|nr:hypothetical protein [Flavobacterium sp. K77]MCF6142062.1 hypothetical protein [Flavobacterium sp. K77]
MKIYLFFLSMIFLISNESKEKIIGNLNSYNLKIIVETDPTKKTDEIDFHHVIKEKIYFRNKAEILSTEIIEVKSNDGYILTGINTLKSKNKNIYQMEYYRSNGSPEIFVYFDNRGTKLCKQTAFRNKTEYNFIKKGLNTKYFDDLKIVKSYDLIDLF